MKITFRVTLHDPYEKKSIYYLKKELMELVKFIIESNDEDMHIIIIEE